MASRHTMGVADVADHHAANHRVAEHRIISVLADEAHDPFLWGRLDAVHADMFSAGPTLAVKFAYFGKETQGARSRPLTSTRWARDPDDLRHLMDHARANCVCGCFAMVADILNEALRETETGPLQAVTIVGDQFYGGDRNETIESAEKLRDAGTRLFVFAHAKRRSPVAGVAKQLATITKGAFIEFSPAVERVAERLPRYFKAVAHYAVGGPEALEALNDSSAKLLLGQLH